MDNYVNVNDNEEWNELSIPVIKNEVQPQTEPRTSSESSDKRTSIKRFSTPVLTIQLTACLLLLIILFLLKAFNYDVFTQIKDKYDSELNASMYFSGDVGNLDYSSIFSTTVDEI